MEKGTQGGRDGENHPEGRVGPSAHGARALRTGSPDRAQELRKALAGAAVQPGAASLALGPQEVDCHSPKSSQESQHRKDDSSRPDAIALRPPPGGHLGRDHASQVQHVAQCPANIGATGLWDTQPGQGCGQLLRSP